MDVGAKRQCHVNDDDCRSGSPPEVLQYRVWPVSRTETFNAQVHWPNLQMRYRAQPSSQKLIRYRTASRSRSDGRSRRYVQYRVDQSQTETIIAKPILSILSGGSRRPRVKATKPRQMFQRCLIFNFGRCWKCARTKNTRKKNDCTIWTEDSAERSKHALKLNRKHCYIYGMYRTYYSLK